MCEITTDYEKQNCASNGGNDEVIIYNMENRNDSSVTIVDGVITAMTMNSGKRAYRITPDTESIVAGFVGTRSRENNSYMVANTCAITLKDILTATVGFSEKLGKGFYGIIVKRAGATDYIHLGFEYGMTLTTDDATTGQAYEDMAGMTLNFEGKELVKPYRVASGVITTITTAVS